MGMLRQRLRVHPCLEQRLHRHRDRRPWGKQRGRGWALDENKRHVSSRLRRRAHHADCHRAPKQAAACLFEVGVYIRFLDLLRRDHCRRELVGLACRLRLGYGEVCERHDHPHNPACETHENRASRADLSLHRHARRWPPAQHGDSLVDHGVDDLHVVHRCDLCRADGQVVCGRHRQQSRRDWPQQFPNHSQFDVGAGENDDIRRLD
mmetsp:Transcript_69123/g.192409  ORF Transcript_69123/g.192409 Transcript_69123/m.192409 type:complete len:207 (-) Transcript_69123:1923-2543(-)